MKLAKCKDTILVTPVFLSTKIFITHNLDTVDYADNVAISDNVMTSHTFGPILNNIRHSLTKSQRHESLVTDGVTS